MTTQHTPGPWKNNTAATVRAHNGKILVAQVTWPPGTRVEERRANANLIAAAPEMLDALNTFVDSIPIIDMPNHREALTKARAAIAKAYGQNASMDEREKQS